MATPEQREALRSLRQLYLARLPSKVAELAEAARGWSVSAKPEELEALYHLTHRLTGSAAIYALDELSEASRTGENLLLSALEGGPAELRECIAELPTLIRNLERAAGAAALERESEP